VTETVSYRVKAKYVNCDLDSTFVTITSSFAQTSAG